MSHLSVRELPELGDGLSVGPHDPISEVEREQGTVPRANASGRRGTLTHPRQSPGTSHGSHGRRRGDGSAVRARPHRWWPADHPLGIPRAGVGVTAPSVHRPKPDGRGGGGRGPWRGALRVLLALPRGLESLQERHGVLEGILILRDLETIRRLRGTQRDTEMVASEMVTPWC